MKRAIALGLILAALAATGCFVVFMSSMIPKSCSNSATATASVLRSQLQYVEFGAIRKYKLPSGRAPNAITVASDGSVWFGEQALPGIAHLYANGTLLEYTWPFQYKAPPGFTYIWGIAVWDGCVWASDQAGSQLVAVDPTSAQIRTVSLNAGSFPYTMTVGPDDSLWFTEVFASKLARIDNQLNLHEYDLPLAGTPGQVVFANNTQGYYVDTGIVGLVAPGIYRFDPSSFSPILIDSSVTKLTSPTSIALTSSGVWAVQHATSLLAYYDFTSRQLTQYPTTPVSYVKTTLPYFVAANGSLVWFNEHYGNRIGVIDTKRGLLTEYSVSNPPANKASQIDNALTIALGKDKVWFTELTADYVGYVNAAYEPPFSLQPVKVSVDIVNGKNTTVALTFQGKSERNLTILSSDSETFTGRPQSISLSLTETGPSNVQSQMMTLTISAKAAPGRYELLVSATNGVVTQGVYLTLLVL
jgi:virginiamycin B lyase